MKRRFYSLLLIAIVLPLYAQQTGPLFKPTKISYYYEPIGGWDLETVRKFKYDTKGNATLILTEAGNGTPIRKDSNVYSSTSQILEMHRFVWSGTEKRYLFDEKIINIYDVQDRLTGSLIYLWIGLWYLSAGTEHLIAYDPATKTETEITKLYDEVTEKWDNLAKTVTKFNALGQTDSIILYSTDAQHNFTLFSRKGFTGWHNYEKEISKGEKIERYVNGTWELESTSSTEEISGLWVRTELKATGPAAGTYKILFEDDFSFREVMKQSAGGWLSLSNFSRTGNIEKMVQNGFEGDILKTIETDEKEVDDKGNLIRTTQRIQGQNLQTTSFSEVLTDILYDSRNLLLEEISKVTNVEDRNNYVLFEKIVYSDYVDVGIVTDLESTTHQNDGNSISIFPNPGIGIFTVSANASISNATVFSSDGQCLRNTAVAGNKLDISDLPAGVYQLLLDSEKGIFREKVVVFTP